jgi:hypothetical protein
MGTGMSQHFKFGRSVYLAAMLCLAHVTFLIFLPLLALSAWSRLALAAMVLCSLVYYLRHEVWLAAPSSCTGLVLDGENAVLVLRNGSHLRGRIAGGSLVTPWLAVLNVSLLQRKGTRSVLILPASMAKDAFRQLRVWLKWGAQDAG